MMVLTEQVDRIKERLKSKGYKLTPQRETTIRVLLEHEKDHLSAEEVFLLVKERFPEIGMATVYRVLDLLNELQIVQKVNFGDGAARFDLRAANSPHLHHHLICTRCGSVEEIMEDWLVALEKRVEREYGFTVTDHRLDFQGVCSACQAKEREKNKGGKNCQAVS